MQEAILREKRLKRWRRNWKIALIESRNPGWRDLMADVLDGRTPLEAFDEIVSRGDSGT